MDTGKIVSMSNRRARCDECTVQESCLSRDVDHPDAEGRHDILVAPRIVHRGDHLFRAGDEFESLFVVRSGAVKSYMISETGEEQVIGFHMPGEIIGLDAIDGSCHECSAAALDTSSVCALPFSALTRLCTRSRTTLARLLGGVSRKVLGDEQMLLVLGRKSAEQRMAAFLIDQMERRARQGLCGTEINLPMSRSDIGSFLALAVETVSRVLTRLQESEVIAVRRNQIRILDQQGLRRVAGLGPVAGVDAGRRAAR